MRGDRKLSVSSGTAPLRLSINGSRGRLPHVSLQSFPSCNYGSRDFSGFFTAYSQNGAILEALHAIGQNDAEAVGGKEPR